MLADLWEIFDSIGESTIRFILAAWFFTKALVAILSAIPFGRRKKQISIKIKPTRKGSSELARTIAGSRDSTFYAYLVSARARLVLRDIVALRHSLSDNDAAQFLRKGDCGFSQKSMDCIFDVNKDNSKNFYEAFEAFLEEAESGER